VASLKDSPTLASLRVDSLRQRLAKYGSAIASEAEQLYAVMNVDLAKQRSQLEELLQQMKNGDVRRGQLVFNSAKAACASCHAIGYLGGKIGPDLTHIAQTRQERDLLEAIVHPSASFVRSYEPVSVSTANGKVYNGLLAQEGPDELTLTISATESVRIPRKEVEEMRPSTVSIMPAGLDKQLTVEQLADLLAFLKACR
jgi:putative heme-binding domain-containing protein